MMLPSAFSSRENGHGWCLSAFHRNGFSTDFTGKETKDKSSNNVTDYFALLGVKRQFLLDPKELQNSYRKLMTKHHPDMQHQRTADDGGETEDASQITHAYYTLQKPHTRATHLLELVGRPMEEESSNAASLVGPAFLMEVMEWREAIEAIPGVVDGGGGEEMNRELQDMYDQTQSKMEVVLQDLDSAFREGNLDKALELSAQLQYWHRIEVTIQEKL